MQCSKKRKLVVVVAFSTDQSVLCDLQEFSGKFSIIKTYQYICDLNIDVNYNVYSNNCSSLYFGRFSLKQFVHEFKSSFSKMACQTLWNTNRDESFHSDVSEIDLMYSTKESENKDAECIS